MAAPWEKYQQAEAADATGPWSRYSEDKKKPAKAADSLKSEAYESGKQQTNPVVRGFANVINGPLFGFGDELIGAIGAVPGALSTGQGVPQAYRDIRDYTRGVQDQYKQDFPIGSVATQLAASAPMMVKNPLAGLGGAVAPRTTAAVSQWAAAPRVGAAALGARMAAAAGSGAAYGGISGLGESTADDLYGLALDTGKGSLMGAGMSAAAPVVGKVGMGGYNQIATRVSGSAAERVAREKVAEAVVRDARGTAFETGASNAGSQAAARFAKLGPEARIADAGGENTRQLLDTLATLPGRTKNLTEAAIRERQAGRAGRLIEAADDALKVGGQRAADSIDNWVATRQMQSQPLYNQLYRLRVQPTSELQGIVAAADQLGATKLARDIATARRLPYSLDPASPGSWSMRDLDLVKQGLDSVIAKKWDNQAGKYTPEGVALLDLKNALTGALDRLTTNRQGQSLYRNARDAFAGPSALVDAVNTGRRAFLQDDASIRRAMEGLSTSEMDAFRLGAFESLRSKLGGMSGQTQILNMWREPATREKLQAIFGDERSYRQFAASVAREARLKPLEQVGRGSKTAARQYGAGDLDVSAVGDLTSAAASPSLPALSKLVGGWNRAQTPEAVRDRMGQILLSRDPITMRELELLAPMLSAERSRRAAAAGVAGGLLAN